MENFKEVREFEMNALLTFGLGSGLAAAAAYRGFFPLVMALLMVRYTRLINFPQALDWLQSTPMLLLLLAVMVVEFLVDEFPGVSFLHSSIYTAVKVLIGGILFSTVVQINPVLGIILGGLITGLIAFSQLAFEPLIMDSQNYFRDLEYSTIETVGSIVLTVIAIATPFLSLVVIVGLVYGTFRVGRKIT